VAAVNPNQEVFQLTPTSTGSYVIDMLPADTRARWQKQLAEVTVRPGAVLISNGQAISHVYFPTTALVASYNPDATDTPMAATLVGPSKFLGLGVLLGNSPARHNMTVLLPGKVLRLESALLRDEFNRSPEVRSAVMELTGSYIGELTQLATCNRFHTLEQQLCLRLLQIIDHQQTDELVITQAELALLIGARRERVNQIVGDLQAAGILDLGRGRLTRLDHPGLLRQVCGCYAVLARAQERIKRLAEEARAG
jgi:CRP-like cAMP-binding protein